VATTTTDGQDGPSPRGIELPPGRQVVLRDRGTTFIREVAGPPGAPVVVLLHGLGADADLNWFSCYEPLGGRYRVIAIDHRGHGHGIRSRRPFRLADCADDVVALCRELGIDRIVPVGYSMGGPIAQLLWHRHPSMVRGLVLCATAAHFADSRFRRISTAMAPGLAVFGRFTPRELPPNPIARQLVLSRLADPGVRRWVAERGRRLDPLAAAQAVAAIGRFSSRSWLGTVDVPTAVVVTQFDRAVSRARQEQLASLIPGATVHRVLGDHGVCAVRPDLFVPALLEALGSVTSRP
jgi:3-oxoadipate enol-lactonase